MTTLKPTKGLCSSCRTPTVFEGDSHLCATCRRDPDKLATEAQTRQELSAAFERLFGSHLLPTGTPGIMRVDGKFPANLGKKQR